VKKVEAMAENNPNQDDEDDLVMRNSGMQPKMRNTNPTDQSPIVDQLGIIDLNDIIIPTETAVFAAAGRDAPVAEFAEDFLVMHPPHLPLVEDRACEVITEQVDERGILLDELGVPRKIGATKYRGLPLYVSGEQEEDSTRHIAVVLDEHNGTHFVYDEDGKRLNSDEIYKLRTKSVDGELSSIEGITVPSLDEADNF
jgi:hypothetical protein